jgi:hypothetical protein
MYFSKIPNVYAPFTIGGVEQYIQIKDITVNVRFVTEFLSNITVYDLYDIRDGETPELLAERFYGTPTYHWAIMLANDRYDYINDFPIAPNVFEDYVYQKYNVPFDAASWEYDGSIVTVTQPDHGLLTNQILHTRVDSKITATIGSPIVAGIGFHFPYTSPAPKNLIRIGDIIYNSAGVLVGLVQSIINSTSIALGALAQASIESGDDFYIFRVTPTNSHVTLSNAYTTIIGTGTITTIAGSTAVVGSSTLFTSQVSVGHTLRNSSGEVIGVVSKIIDATHITLVDIATISLTVASYKISTSVTGMYPIYNVTPTTFSFNHLTPLTGTANETMNITPSGLTAYTHHYETAAGLTVDSDWVGRFEVSNYTYEDRLNESKRTIKVISQSIIEQVGREYVKALA